MKPMKKMIPLILSGIMLISAVAACNNDTNSENEKTESQAESMMNEAFDQKTDKSAKKTVESESNINGQINIYTRDAASGTRDGFESVVGFKNQLTDKANEVASNGEMATQVGKDRQAIGYVSLTTDFASNHLKAVNYENVEASESNVLSGDYQLSRPFNYVTRASGDYNSDEEEQLVKAFIDFLTHSQEGLEAVASEGGIVDLDSAVPWSDLAKNHPIVERDNSEITIKTGGSTSVEKTIKAALNAFVPYAGNFNFEMDQTGSGDGWKRVLGAEKDGPTAAHIGFASRNFKDDEDVTSAIAGGTYCLDAIVVVVESHNPIENVTQEQVFDIFTGAIDNWQAISQ